MASSVPNRGWRRLFAAATLSLLGGSVGACEEPVPPDPAPVVWEGERIEIATHDELLACGGSFDYLDDFVFALQDDHGLEWGGTPIRYYMLTSEELAALDFCPPGARCIKDHRVYTDVAVDLHEMVHAIRSESLGQPLPGITYFEEGLAVLYDPETRTEDPSLDVYAGLESIADLNEYMSARHYGVAGHFTRFLVDTYGIEGHVAFVQAQASVGTVAELEVTFEETTGEPFAGVVDEYRAQYPLCSDLARTRHLLECAQPPVQPDGNSLRVEYELSCDDPEVLGPVGGRMWRSFTIEVITPGRYRFTNGISPFDFQLEVVDCDRGCLTDVDIAVQSPGTIFDQPELSAGRYLVRLSREVDAPGRAGIDISGFQ